MSKKGIFIGFRLHPDIEQERDAIEIYNRLLREKFTARQIMTDALLRLDGKKPEMFQDYTRQVTKPYIEDLLADFAQHLISEIRSMGLGVSVSPVSQETPLTEDEDEQYAKNLAAGYLSRRKR